MSDQLFTGYSTFEAEAKARATAMAEDQATIDKLRARVEVLEAALRGVVRVADRATPEFDAARAALQQEGET